MIFFLFLSFLFPLAGDAKKKETAYAIPRGAVATVVIDAGHGGRNKGTCSKSPYCEEKRVCLQTARLVRKYLDQLGYHVVMTRDSDSFIPLPRRVEVSAQAASSVFVSIHYNHAKSPQAQGVEIFFYDSKKNPSRAASSKHLAEAILPGVIKRTGAASRGVKKGNFYVLRENTIPAILIEGGFLSNSQECLQIKNPKYQDKIARGIADGIDHYLKRH